LQRVNYALSQIYFYLTDGCNLACRHCWLAPRFGTAGAETPVLPVALFETAIREAKPLGLSAVKLTGGEPLLHPSFPALLEIVRQEGLSLNIETNGLLCTPEIVAEIAKSQERFVSVSLDGADAPTHEWVRRVPGSFERALTALRMLVDAGIQTQIILSIMRCNADQVDAIVRLAESLGASSLKFNPVMPIARGATLQETNGTLDVPEIIRLGRYVEMVLAPKTHLRLDFDYPPAFRPLSRLAAGNSPDTCGILHILGVIADGHYALCGIGKHVPELVFGRVGVERLAALWQDCSILQELRAGLPDRLNGVCSQCLMKHRCLGSCMAQNYYRTGSLWAPFWFCEAAEKEGLFPATRLAGMTT
jgi:SynChlorMet cassette radical SAM/SPASM protein ScmF